MQEREQILLLCQALPDRLTGVQRGRRPSMYGVRMVAK